MRSLAAVIALAASTGCVDIAPIELGGCDLHILPGPCVDTDHPFQFTNNEPVLAAGGRSNVAYLALDTLTDIQMRSTNATVLQIEESTPKVFVMRGLADGDAAIEARDGTGRILGGIPIRVRNIASATFAFGPAVRAPLSRLAALPGAVERIRVVPLDRDGDVVGGADPVIQLELTGELARTDVANAQPRIGELRLFDSAPPHGFDVGVQIGGIGAGSITASAGGTALGTLPIDVIPAATDVSLVLGGRPVTGAVVVVGLVGTDLRGIPVAGLVGDFTADPAELVYIPVVNDRGEVIIEARAPGQVTITATLPDRTLSLQFMIE